MNIWFVQGPEEETGPFRPAELLELVRQGKIRPETLLRKDDSAWFEAAQVGGLFEAAVRPTMEYFCPACNTRIRKPPSNCNECGQEVFQARTRKTEHHILTDEEHQIASQAKRSVKRWLNKVRSKNGDEE